MYAAGRVCVSVIVLLLSGLPALAATRIELVIDELRENRTVPWPITTGVPFPQGKLTRANQCRLVDDRGQEQPLQTKVAATWDAAKSSIRWLTIDFIAQPGRKYALEFGPDVAQQTFPQALSLVQRETLRVATGPLEVEFARHGPSPLHAVRIDLNKDGTIEDSEIIAAGPQEGDHVYVNQRGERAANRHDNEQRALVVETNGPVRACIRVDGWYTGVKGERIVKYRTRYHLFAGLSLVKVVDEFRIQGSTRDTQLTDIALPLLVSLRERQRQTVVPAQQGNFEAISIPWQSGAQSVSSVQETYRHYGNTECRAYVVEQGETEEAVSRESERAGPWIQISDDHAAITGSLRWFWQQFPKQWEVTRDQLVLHLWSPRAGTLDFGEEGLRKFFGPAGHKYLLDWAGTRQPQTPIENFFYFAGRHALKRDGADGLGINEHHEIWYHFGRANEAAAGREYGDLADRQPLCLATGQWNCSTGVFGTLATRPNDSPYEAIVDRIFDLERYAQDAFGDYGWWLFGAGPHYSYQWDPETKRHYADPRRFEYHTYQRETQLWWCYLRSGERKFYDWAIPSENHWVDVAVSHVPTKFSTEWRGGAAGEATLHFPAGDWSIDSPLHYVRHHDTGEAWLRSASQYWASYHRTLETTTLAYFLTGDERYNDVINFWRDYWGALAGVRSDSTDARPWHREQMWFQPTKPDEPTKSWAEMLRDYAPFQSGSRHQMTLFFNLATLYEHTWDPIIKQVLQEYADAFIKPDDRNGVWQCQDHRLPANADCPMLAHYWSPALWKYARASGDPRMPEVLRKYFTACYEADPYGEDVGVYSNVQIGWAWHFTRDPRHLIAARHELQELLPNAAPLEKPEDLGPRIYNPHNPIKALTATPRLIGALEEAKRAGVELPAMPPLTPQRTVIALKQRDRARLTASLWGWQSQFDAASTTGKYRGRTTKTTISHSHRQPFDRTMPNHEVYRSVLDLPAFDNDPWVYLSAELETGILELNGADAIWCWGGEPVRIEPRQTWWWQRSGKVNEIVLESAQAAQLQVRHGDQPLTGKVVKNVLTVALADLPESALVAVETRGSQSAWFRIQGDDGMSKWVTMAPVKNALPPPVPAALLAKRQRPAIDLQQTFLPGKFGQGLLIVPGRELHIPDEVTLADGTARRLSDQRQGTIEFWVRRMWDERLAYVPGQIQFLNNGSLQAWCPWKLPLDEWAHVAVVWRPIKAPSINSVDGAGNADSRAGSLPASKDIPDRSLVHIYVDGRDFAFYRSLYWAGYAPPPTFGSAKQWLKEFVVRAPPGTMYAIDDLRISTVPRYVDLSLDFGRQQTFNPHQFTPAEQPSQADESTVLWFPLDGDTRGTTIGGKPIEARLVMERR